MCYFDGVPKIRDVKIPRRRAIRAWKGFDKGEKGVWISPVRCFSATWRLGVPNKATANGFYAVAKRPRPKDNAAGGGRYVKRVLLWGRVQEYKGIEPWWRKEHGYRAQFCMILPAKPTK